LVVELIASTSTKAGLTVRCELDSNVFAKGIKVPEQEMAAPNLKGDDFYQDWNYSILPRCNNVER
jgi:hypothetical protein